MYYIIISDGIPIPLTYAYHEKLLIGDLVIVTVRQRELLGVIVEILNDDIPLKVKPCTRIVGINIGCNLINFIKKLSDYSLYPVHGFLKSIIPKFYNRNKLTHKDKENWQPYNIKIPLTFNEEQQKAVDIISECPHYATFLLYGTTGSGKTEVSIGAIINIIQQGGQVLILLPEISLINQWVHRIKKYLDCPIVIYHSLQGKNKSNWEKILYEKGLIVVGARSAIFLPFQNLKLIIVDEEHDTSYKQDTKPIYNARDAAVMRGNYEKCPVVLASATPSLESLSNVQSHKYQMITIKNKFHGNGIVDINFSPMDIRILSDKLLREIKATYLMGKKSIVFVNRRGYGNKVKCNNCHSVLACKYCDFCLVYHKLFNKYLCHLCNYEQKNHICPSCKQDNYLQSYGLGVEKVEEFLKENLPDKETMIFSSDTTGTKKELEEKLNKINDNEPLIIIGTQMLSKGHDLGNLHLVIILDLNICNTDFRGREKSLQLLTQIIGRVGRQEGNYKAFIQLDMANPFSQFVMENFQTGKSIDYRHLLNQELDDRRQWQLPPFINMINIYIQNSQQTIAHNEAMKIWEILHSYSNEKLRITKPLPMAIPRKKGLWHYFITVMMDKSVAYHKIFQFSTFKSNIIFDVNPNFIM